MVPMKIYREVKMLAKVLIRRKFRTGHTKEIVALLNDLRAVAMRQAGYLSGLTLMAPDNSNNMLVIGTWQSLEDWYRWKADPDRTRLEAMLEIYQDGPTQYEAYVVGTGFTG
ncbi:MAG: antibiotic biosynthesis monooxygenase [Deltaproteobacteria bacterium]|nr:antibiotic biosynthesis monooxygenase [Deltaproteobacteria bacterium]